MADEQGSGAAAPAATETTERPAGEQRQQRGRWRRWRWSWRDDRGGGGGGRGGRGRDREREREGSDLVENVVAINRVAKVVKGGRRFSFNALVAVGDGRARSGSRPARRTKCPKRSARRSRRRKRSMVEVPRTGSTIPHEIIGQHGAGKVLLKPAAPGAGVIAGGAVRAVLECAGITDILTKSLGSTNPHNMVRAAMDGLRQLVTVARWPASAASKSTSSRTSRGRERKSWVVIR